MDDDGLMMSYLTRVYILPHSNIANIQASKQGFSNHKRKAKLNQIEFSVQCLFELQRKEKVYSLKTTNLWR